MKQDGITVRPIKQIDSSSEFNEVFFENARCKREDVVGGVNNGWKVAMTTLGFERGASSTTGFRRFARELDQIIAQARRLGRSSDPIVRQDLARAWSKVKIMQINGYRTLTDALNGTHNTVALGATNKMFWSEYHKKTMDLAMTILGSEGQILTGSAGASSVDDVDDDSPLARRGSKAYPVDAIQGAFFFSISETIWGGTAEIQRNIVGERVLGLPKEPKPQSQASPN